MSKRTKKGYEECERCYKKNYCSRDKARYCLIRFLIWETLNRKET